MKYIKIEGYRYGSILLYSYSEKCLYVKKSTRKGGQESWICYQSVLSDKKVKNSENISKCTARVTMFNNACERNNIAHTAHNSHEILFKDIVSKNNMIKTCRFLKENVGESSHKLSVNDIYCHEMKK